MHLFEEGDAEVTRFDVGVIGFGVEALGDFDAGGEEFVGVCENGFGAAVHVLLVQGGVVDEAMADEVFEGL